MRSEALLVAASTLTAVSMALVTLSTVERGEPPERLETMAAGTEWEDPTPPTTTTMEPEPTTTTMAPPPPRVRTATASAPVPARVAPGPGPCAGLEGEIAARWPADQVSTACRVMMCESGGSPTAQNPRSTASGLWQFLKSTWANFGGYAEAWMAPINVQMDGAHALWSRSGWRPWSCR